MTYCRLTENLRQAHDWNHSAPDDVGERLAGTNRRQLVDVADKKNGRMVGNGPQERVHKADVDHGGLIDNQEVAGQRIVLVSPEPARLRIRLKQTMDRPRLTPRRLPHPLGGPAGRPA
jgi:hypothetical protein